MFVDDKTNRSVLVHTTINTHHLRIHKTMTTQIRTSVPSSPYEGGDRGIACHTNESTHLSILRVEQFRFEARIRGRGAIVRGDAVILPATATTATVAVATATTTATAMSRGIVV